MNSSALSVLARDPHTANNLPSSRDGRAPKRQHRVPSENETPWTQTPLFDGAPKTSMDARSSLANRRRSGLRDYKPPLGPRPPDFANSKRISSESVNTSQPPNPRRSFLPNTTNEPFLGLSARRRPSESDSAYPLNSGQPQAGVTRDMASPQRPAIPPQSTRLQTDENGKDLDSSGIAQHATPSITLARPSPSSSNSDTKSVPMPRASPSKPRNPALRAAQLSTASAPGPSAVTPSTMRTRRQSQMPPPANPALPDARQPRQSIGPGLPLQGSARDRLAPEPMHRFPLPVTSNGRSPDFTWNFTNVKPKPRASMMPAIEPGLQSDGSTDSRRNVKARSFHPGLRAEPAPILPNLPGDVSSSDDLDRKNERVSRNLNQAKRPNPPASAVRRQTLGLARAVSPTDARKLKRASVVEQPPPMPARSPTPEWSSATQSARHSPIPPRQKSVTPLSFRATPEINQGPLAGRPLSSRSSFNSSRPLSSSLQQQAAASALNDAPKPKLSDGASVGDDEFVPPVPAIPKAFGSPKQSVDRLFLKSLEPPSPSLQALDAKPVRNVEPVQSSEARVAAPDLQQQSKADFSSFPMANEPRSRRRYTMGTKAEESKSAPAQASNRQASHQARLPPLTLLPLSQPTSEKIASIAAKKSHSQPSGSATPPLPRQSAKTPSTPMTASKATFPTFEFPNVNETATLSSLREGETGRGALVEPKTQQESNGSSPTTFLTTSPRETPPAVSPVSSMPTVPSRPNYSSHSNHEDLSKTREPQSDHRTSRLISLRGRTFSRTGKDSGGSHPGTGSQVDATPTGRRKLSLSGWRRSSSKTSQSHSTDETLDLNGEKIPDLPPPRIPASTAVTAEPPAHAKPIHTNETAKSPKTTSLFKERKQSEGSKSQEPSEPHVASSDQPPAVSEKTTTFRSPMNKILSSRRATSPISSANRALDMNRDDMAADEEMRRLGAKKKEFEAAAKEVDHLRRKASPKERQSPAQAARAANLNIFERGEIIDYADVYFCGSKDARKCIGDLAAQSSNYGFDDERGDYNIVMGDHISYRYEVIDILGKGSFGQVVRCIDHRTGKLVAVKIIRNKQRFHQQALVEVNILQRLRDWDPQMKFSNVEFTQSFYFRGHLCIATELLGMNLYEFIKAHDFKGFSLKLIRRFTRQILSSLSLLQANRVIHCDLKPENILLAHPLQSEIKVIDFGSSCFENEKVYTYIQSRFYRSPEVILGMDYGMPIDMWSIGCILAELFTGYPIFPGENEQEQLACIMEVFGPPEKHLIERSSRKKLFFDSLGKPRVTVSSKGKRRRPSSKTLQQAIKCDDETFLDFLTQCLRWDPERRMKPGQALTHDFVTGAKSSSRVVTNSGASSPAKRITPISQTPVKATIRPLPEPPATSYKNGVPTNARVASLSPLKSGMPPRRHSTILGFQPGLGVKRGPNAAAVGSGLPRSASGKPDMASAAAIASLRQR